MKKMSLFVNLFISFGLVICMSGCIGATIDIAEGVTDAAFDVAEAAVEVPFAVADGVTSIPHSALKVKYEKEFDWDFEAQGIETIDADTTNGSITVTGGEQQEIRVHAKMVIKSTSRKRAESFAEKVSVIAVTDGDTLKISKDHPKKPKDIQIAIHYQIDMPIQTNLDLHTTNGGIRVHHAEGDLLAKTTNGSVRVDDATGEIEMRTTNGSIGLKKAKGEAVMTTTNGSVTLESFAGKAKGQTMNARIKANIIKLTDDSSFTTTNGSIDIHTQEAMAPILARSTNGSIDLAIKKGIVPISAQSTNGSITLKLPDNYSGQLEARSSRSSIRSDFSIKTRKISRKQVQGEIGSGGETKVTIRTSNGGIHIKKY